MTDVKVTFKTITPLWTGNAWRGCKEIRPSSILGSLRFWFEVLCYFNGVINDSYFDESGKSMKTFDYKVKNSERYDIEKLINAGIISSYIASPTLQNVSS